MVNKLGPTAAKAAESFLATQPISVAALRAHLDHIEGPFVVKIWRLLHLNHMTLSA
jgi:hypothetical protein